MIQTRTLAACAAALTFALSAGATHGQDRPVDQADQLLTSAPPTVNDGEAYHRADDAEQDPSEVRTTQALNDEIASRNQLAENQEQADRAKYEATVTASTQAQLAYEEDARRAAANQSAWEAEQARWQEDRARWEADVRACQAGDRRRCGPPRY